MTVSEAVPPWTMSSGASNREIAEALVVTDNTVTYHLKNILQKLHLRNRAQVVAYALQRGVDRA